MSDSQNVNKKRRRTDKNALFSIGAKLVTIVTLIVLFSLGSITALVSWLVRQDLRISAEENNYEANRRSAAEAEETFLKMRTDAIILIQMVSSAGPRSSLARETTKFFFENNTRIAAISFDAGGRNESFINERFFNTNGIVYTLTDSFFEGHKSAMSRAALGETVVINATPHFAKSLIAMFFNITENGAAAIIFSLENLNYSFGAGINKSYMINSHGDILIHVDYDLMRNNTNISDKDFIIDIKSSLHRSSQALIETDFGVIPIEADNPAFLMPQLEQVYNFLKPAFISLHYNIMIFFNNCRNAIYRVFQIEKSSDSAVNAEETADSMINQEKTVRQFVAFTKLNTGGCIVITNIEYNRVFEGITATTRRNIYLTIVVMFFSIMLIWFFSKTISIPLKSLAAAARKIEGGEFNLHFDPKGRDEIGILTASFQKMCAALNIFGRFTNKEIALQAMRNQIKPGGLPKHATIFFSDIREFTAKSEGFTNYFGFEASNYIVHWLNKYFTQMIDCVEKTGGCIDKFIGDAVMAHWGTAYTAGSARADAFNCVKAALMMRKALYFMNRERKKDDPGDPAIRIGCGINTGMVTAGQLGSDMRMEYTVIGDPVNLASRIEALTKPLGADILISEDTWNLIGDKFVTEEMPSVTVKGKVKPVRIFAVVNFAGEEKGPQSLDEVRDLLEIKAPELEGVDLNEGEKKYKIGGDNKGKE